MMRILALTHRLPYAPNRGDRVRAFHELRILGAQADVELVSLVHDDEEARHVGDLKSIVSRVTAIRVPKLRNYVAALRAIPTARPLTHALLDAPEMMPTLRHICQVRRPDLVFAYCSGMARFAMELDDIPFALDFVDMDSQKWREMAASSALPLSWIYAREAATLGAFEARAATKARVAFVVNQREASIARALAPQASVVVLENGVDATKLTPHAPPSAEARVVFCGVMNYAPNDEGMRWFVREVWPLVVQGRADATLTIVGSDPTSTLRAMCRRDPRIHVTGRVLDVRPWLWRSAVAIAPLRVARGIQNKVLEAIAAGLPTVITDEVRAGLPAAVQSATRLGQSPRQFAQCVLEFLELAPNERREVAGSADLEGLRWEHTLAHLEQTLEVAAIQNCTAA